MAIVWFNSIPGIYRNKVEWMGKWHIYQDIYKFNAEKCDKNFLSRGKEQYKYIDRNTNRTCPILNSKLYCLKIHFEMSITFKMYRHFWFCSFECFSFSFPLKKNYPIFLQWVCSIDSWISFFHWSFHSKSL